MGRNDRVDAIVVGAGPNGLAAAIELARAGVSVVVFEADERPGGGCRSAELTEPGFVHDVCSAIHPLAVASPFMEALDLKGLGVELVQPAASLAHLLGPKRAVMLERDVAATAARLGRDAKAYRKLMTPLVDRSPALVRAVLSPVRLPKHPLTLARFARGVLPAAWLKRRFQDEAAPALLAGIAAHSVLPLSRPPTAGVALLLGHLAHAAGWPMVGGGSERLTDAMVLRLRELGGEIRTGHPVQRLDEVSDARAVLFDTSAGALADIAGADLPRRYVRALRRFRQGPGVFKVDWALDEPIPWSDPEVARAGTVHLSGTFDDIAASEAATWQGKLPPNPFVLLAQQSLFDPTRAPAGKHTAWAYIHVPHGWPGDATAVVEGQIERFAPGFRDTVRARHTFTTSALESYNANYIGGDISGGVQDLRQTIARPTFRWDPYSTPNDRIYLCSSATPPGGGVHGMCGALAARSALKRSFGISLHRSR